MSRQREGGFTLVELLVAITVLVLITGPLTTAFVVALRTTDEATERLSLAHDLQISAATFASDIHSATGVWVTDPAPACNPAGGSTVLLLGWTAGPTSHLVHYTLVSAGGEKRLVRQHCETGQSDEVQVVSHLVGSVQPATCGADACTGTAGAPERPRRVALTVVDVAGADHTILGTRRTYS